MTRRTDTHPDLTRPEVGAPFFSTWRVGTPERQKQTVEAIAHTWEHRPWPVADLYGYYVYVGHDGSTLLHHSQWASEQAYEGFARTHRQERNDEIDTAVPGIERVALARYRRYRSHERVAGDLRVPGLIVTVRIDFEPEAADKRRDWVDAVLGASTTPESDRGLISAHFHLSTDGTHVLNYAAWESDQTYDEAIDAPASPEWERVRAYPGLKGFTGTRYRYALGLVPD
ncbi:antibiotic biosynthesis monooxygenase [Streptomyces sp. DG2A-72]|uniref:antibiotic biosynthesis monooxygenase n=1 Tax=Streptomyces sp. DG2A-72 TaxID=3051386 RepID=UPI00265C2B2F|nr:antibiotic biosynthesis monooxygenase [Streptomyces sp. DG2A-72]MDO0932141.1 antibiotic biosynthesis monooxygenase [Streptomyces sp. DG2A-72]